MRQILAVLFMTALVAVGCAGAENKTDTLAASDDTDLTAQTNEVTSDPAEAEEQTTPAEEPEEQRAADEPAEEQSESEPSVAPVSAATSRDFEQRAIAIATAWEQMSRGIFLDPRAFSYSDLESITSAEFLAELETEPVQQNAFSNSSFETRIIVMEGQIRPTGGTLQVAICRRWPEGLVWISYDDATQPAPQDVQAGVSVGAQFAVRLAELPSDDRIVEQVEEEFDCWQGPDDQPANEQAFTEEVNTELQDFVEQFFLASDTYFIEGQDPTIEQIAAPNVIDLLDTQRDDNVNQQVETSVLTLQRSEPFNVVVAEVDNQSVVQTCVEQTVRGSLFPFMRWITAEVTVSGTAGSFLVDEYEILHDASAFSGIGCVPEYASERAIAIAGQWERIQRGAVEDPRTFDFADLEALATEDFLAERVAQGIDQSGFSDSTVESQIIVGGSDPSFLGNAVQVSVCRRFPEGFVVTDYDDRTQQTLSQAGSSVGTNFVVRLDERASGDRIVADFASVENCWQDGQPATELPEPAELPPERIAPAGFTIFGDEAPFTFEVPDGWSVLPGDSNDISCCTFKIGKDTNEAALQDLIEQYGAEGAPAPIDFLDRFPFDGYEDALNSETAEELGYLSVRLGDPPAIELGGPFWDWATVDDIALFINDRDPGLELTPVTVGDYQGFSYDSQGLLSTHDDLTYELLGPDGTRIVATSEIADSVHLDEIEAMIASLQLK